MYIIYTTRTINAFYYIKHETPELSIQKTNNNLIYNIQKCIKSIIFKYIVQSVITQVQLDNTLDVNC